MSDPTLTPNRDQAVWDDDVLARVRSSLERQLQGGARLPVPQEDLVGEALLRLLASDPKRIRYPAAYAGTILRNLVRDKLRELERAQKFFGRIARERLAADRQRERLDCDQSGAVEDGELLERLLEKAALTPIQREVIHMLYFEGKNTSQAARALKRNPGTIQRHHERAIAKLACCAATMESQE